ncbi:MAG TPA: hypothetical protein VFQ61_16735 [Polyangiaceae bacterium]|nr:hypothetical protein [Polyangiaceae bacterium]
MSIAQYLMAGALCLGCAASPSEARAPQPPTASLPPGQARFLCQTEGQCSQAALARCGNRYEVIRKARVQESEPPKGVAVQSNGTRWEWIRDKNRKIYTPRKPLPDLEMVVWCPAQTAS